MTANHGIRGVHVSSGEGIVAHLSNLTALCERRRDSIERAPRPIECPGRRPVARDRPNADGEHCRRRPSRGTRTSRASPSTTTALRRSSLATPTLSITIEGSETILNGRDSSTWIDVALHGAVEQIRAGRQSESIVVGVLRDGVIPAGGFSYNTAGPMPASGRWAELAATTASAPPPDAESRGHHLAQRPPLRRGLLQHRPRTRRHRVHSLECSLESISATAVTTRRRHSPLPEAPGPTRAPDSPPGSPTPPTSGQPPARPDAGTLAPARPQLRGVLCPAGHLTRTGDSACRTCGIATDPDAETVMGDRPVLGVLTFDDGAVLPVDRPAAIGSDIPSGYEIDGSPATAVRLDDGSGGVSAVQVRNTDRRLGCRAS